MYKQSKRRLWLVLRIMMLLLLAAAATATAAQAQEDCLQCHGEQASSVERSVHGAFNCTSCHTDIEGFPHPEDASFTKKESVATCTNCHEGLVTDSYEESFHGKAVNLGSQRSATCVDCHGAHDILGPDNPESKVAKENIAETCAGCHGQASPGFAEGTEHFKFAAVGAGAPMYYTAKFFVWLTIITIVALVIHIELQLYHDLRTILRERRK
ncbi:MAG: cytochrome c3 family protein [Bacillota bacterium]